MLLYLRCGITKYSKYDCLVLFYDDSDLSCTTYHNFLVGSKRGIRTIKGESKLDKDIIRENV